jgi:transposase
VVLEATGDYWRGAFYLLEDCLNVILVNAAHAKGLPGRKTDVSDAAWLCQMGECGLLKASFVPPEPIRHLRDLTRYRATLAVERTREAQRLEKELEDAGIKLSSVAADILGASGRAMLAALIDGERDVHVLAEMAKTRMRPKIPHLVQALTGNFGEHHAFLCRIHLERIDQLSAAILELSTRLEEQMRPFAHHLEQLQTIPGVGTATAEVIIAETAVTWPDSVPPAISPPGRVSARAITNPRANASPVRPDTATDGSVPRWAPPRWAPRASDTTPISGLVITDSHRVWAKRKPSSRCNIRC